jgi:hypothetical protein
MVPARVRALESVVGVIFYRFDGGPFIPSLERGEASP